MKDWSKPVLVSDLDVGMGSINMKRLLPEMGEIPEDFKVYNGKGEAKKWIQIVDDIFFSGAQKIKAVPKKDVDQRMAMRHMKSILHSFEPSHEHKTAGVAYLLSLWFDSFEYESGGV